MSYINQGIRTAYLTSDPVGERMAILDTGAKIGALVGGVRAIRGLNKGRKLVVKELVGLGKDILHGRRSKHY